MSDAKISALPSASTLTGAERLPVSQSNQTRGATTAQLLSSSLFTQTGTGAVARSINSKFGDIVSVKDFNAVGDGVTDDTAARDLATTAASGRALYIPNGNYLFTTKWTIPANTRVFGESKFSTKLLHGYNGDFADLGDGATLDDLYIEGQGATFTGKGILFSGTNGNQSINDCRIINFANNCLDFAVAAGSGSSFVNLQTYQYSAATGSGKYAIVISATQQLSAIPRKFVNIETGGSPSFNFGGCADTFVSTSFLSDLNYTADSRGVFILGCRLANQATLTVDGHNNTIAGCDITPAITIASGADNIHIVGNSTNAATPITDSSANTRNVFNSYLGLQVAMLHLTDNTNFLPAGTGVQTLYMAAGYGSPIVGRIYVGDGTGWKLQFAKRLASVDTVMAAINDDGTISAASKIFPGTDASAAQTVAGIFAGNGAPNNANGANGDFYFRGDGTQAGNTVIYHKQAGSWVALITT